VQKGRKASRQNRGQPANLAHAGIPSQAAARQKPFF